MIMAGRGAGEQVPPHPFKQLTGRECRFPLVFFYPVIFNASEMQVPDFVSLEKKKQEEHLRDPEYLSP